MQVTRSGFYEWQKHKDTPKEDTFLKEKIKAICKLNRDSYGWRRRVLTLNQEGILCNHKKVRRLMKELNLVPKVKKKFKVTTNSNHGLPVEPDRLDRKFYAIGPNIAWVGDITYIATDEGELYLATVIDLCSRKVKGWAMSERMMADLAVCALKMGLASVKNPTGLLFHSDRGVQYT